MNAIERVAGAESDRVTSETVKDDLRVLAADMEQLLRATAGQTGEHVAQVRARAEESLRAAKSRFIDLQDAALARTRAAGRATDDYVHANPWQVMAICAAVGVVLGFLLTRGTASDSTRGTASES